MVIALAWSLISSSIFLRAISMSGSSGIALVKVVVESKESLGWKSTYGEASLTFVADISEKNAA